MTNALEMSSFLKQHWSKSKQFSTKKKSIALQRNLPVS